MKTTYWIKNPYKMFEIDKDNGEFVVIIVEGQRVAVPAIELRETEDEALTGYLSILLYELRPIKRDQVMLSIRREKIQSEIDKVNGLLCKTKQEGVTDVAVSE